MGLKVSADFHDGKNYDGQRVETAAIIEQVRESMWSLASWPVDRIIQVIDAFGKRLLDRSNPIHRLHPMSGIPFIANWCHRQHLERLLETAFESRRCLDRFVPSNGRPDRAYRAFPQGMIVHWMAGNVPTLGFLSLIMGLLTKNGNIIKLAQGSDRLLSSLLEQMAEVEGNHERGGAVLVRTVAVVRYDHTRTDIGKVLSEQADVRIIWGGDEAVRIIKALPTKLETNDIVFPNRTSFIVIGSKAAAGDDLTKLARRVALDVSVFEQKACASPHTIFLVTKRREALTRFAEALREALQDILKTIPKTPPSEKEISALLNLRAQYDMFHDAWYSSGTEFTILADDLFQLGPPIGNRTVYLRMVSNPERLAELITPNVQSIGIEADTEEFERLTSLLGEHGVQRFTKPGSMTHFESPWDGFFLPQHLVRWTSRQVMEATGDG